jgi:peptidoglycan-associated lipoprotein
MRQMYKGFAVGLALAIIVLVPACKTTKKKTNVTATTTETGPPNIATTTEVAMVEPPRDFVNTDTSARPMPEPLPSDFEQLNRVVQNRGFIRDAFFGYDESALTSGGQTALSSSATWLRSNPQYNVLIEGHCDERGTEQYNLALGDRRAAIARDYLITLGVDAGRIRTVSYGEERPFDEDHDESSWAQNRRAHLVLVGR